MKLHNDNDLFRQLILLASEDKSIDAGIIEKDYYVTAFLEMLVKKEPNIIFKGGTSLSKCYKLIQRFSEDIDLNLNCENRPTEGQRKKLKNNIVETMDELKFVLTNAQDVRSRRDYNKYIIDFPSIFDSLNLKQYLIVETSVFLRAFPSKTLEATSYIYDYLYKNGRQDIIKQYSLEPFELQVQDLRRTFIDKLFALGDYYLDGKIIEHSRHIYDVYKLYDAVDIDDSMNELFEYVRSERCTHAACSSAQEGVNLKGVLEKIINEEAYKSDYEAITSKLLFEKVSYETAIETLKEVVSSTLFV